MAKDRPTGGFRFKKRVPIIKLPFGLGDIKMNFSLSHGVESFTAYDDDEGSKWVSVFGTTTRNAAGDLIIPSGHNISVAEDDNKDGSFDVYQGAEEFLNEFGNNPVKSPFQDGHMIYAVVAGGGSGSSSYAPMIYVADLENPKNFNKKLQP